MTSQGWHGNLSSSLQPHMVALFLLLLKYVGRGNGHQARVTTLVGCWNRKSRGATPSPVVGAKGGAAPASEGRPAGGRAVAMDFAGRFVA